MIWKVAGGVLLVAAVGGGLYWALRGQTVTHGGPGATAAEAPAAEAPSEPGRENVTDILKGLGDWAITQLGS